MTPGLLAQSEDRVLLPAATPHREGVVQCRVRPVPTFGVLGGLDHRRSIAAVDVDPEWVKPQRRGASSSDQLHPFLVLLDPKGDRGRERIDADREGGRLVEHTSAADLDPQHVVGHHVDSQLFMVQFGRDARWVG